MFIVSVGYQSTCDVVVQCVGDSCWLQERVVHLKWTELPDLPKTGWIWAKHADDLSTQPPSISEPFALIGDASDPFCRISVLCKADQLNIFANQLKAQVALFLSSKKHPQETLVSSNWKTYPVSIIMPLYNGEEFLEEAIRSVEAQTYPHWEIQIGINGHDEESKTVSFVKDLVSNRPNVHMTVYPFKGKEKTSNALVSKCSYSIVCLFDVDDKWYPSKLEEQLKIWRFGIYDVIGTHAQYFGDRLDAPVLTLKEVTRSLFFKGNNVIINSSMMVARSNCYWDKDSFHLEDYDMWLRNAFEGKRLYNVPKTLTYHRIHRTSAFNNTNQNQVPNLLSRWNQKLSHLTTLVTAYYRIKSKFPSETYQEWMRNFLSLPCCMVIFTDQESLPMLQQMRKQGPTHWMVVPKSEWVVQKWARAYQTSFDLDVEKHHHSIELYQLWNEKTYFVQKAIQANPFQSQWFFWCDIGCMRKRTLVRPLNEFPHPYRVMDLPSHQFILSSIVPFQSTDALCNNQGIPYLFANQCNRSCPNLVRIQGGFFGGHVSQWPQWIRWWTDTHELFSQTGNFLGKDQYLMATIYLKHAKQFYLRQASGSNLLDDPWFDFLFWLSGA